MRRQCSVCCAYDLLSVNVNLFYFLILVAFWACENWIIRENDSSDREDIKFLFLDNSLHFFVPLVPKSGNIIVL